jgi:transposase
MRRARRRRRCSRVDDLSCGEVNQGLCPCSRGELHGIGEDSSERLDIVPAQFRVLVTRRPKYACPYLRGRSRTGPCAGALIEGGLPTGATIIQVVVSKYADPRRRQAQIYARQGTRRRLADWVRHAAWHLRPLHERLLVSLRQLSRLLAEETSAPVLDPGRGRTRSAKEFP